jgi:hypothetical protein
MSLFDKHPKPWWVSSSPCGSYAAFAVVRDARQRIVLSVKGDQLDPAGLSISDADELAHLIAFAATADVDVRAATDAKP